MLVTVNLERQKMKVFIRYPDPTKEKKRDGRWIKSVAGFTISVSII